MKAGPPPAAVAVTVACPRVVDTRIRQRGLGAPGREVVMTAKGKLGRLLKLFVPALVGKMALAALENGARPESR